MELFRYPYNQVSSRWYLKDLLLAAGLLLHGRDSIVVAKSDHIKENFAFCHLPSENWAVFHVSSSAVD